MDHCIILNVHLFLTIVKHMYPTYGACCHISLPFFRGKINKKVYTVLIKQNYIIVLDMWEINVGGNTVDVGLHKLRKSKKRSVVPALTTRGSQRTKSARAR